MNTTQFGFQVYGDERCHWFATMAEAVYFRRILVAGGLQCSRIAAVRKAVSK